VLAAAQSRAILGLFVRVAMGSTLAGTKIARMCTVSRPCAFSMDRGAMNQDTAYEVSFEACEGLERQRETKRPVSIIRVSLFLQDFGMIPSLRRSSIYCLVLFYAHTGRVTLHTHCPG
jgi:hypothetical protein